MLPPAWRAFLDRRVPALRHRNFRIYWFCQFISLIGSWMQAVAQSWLIHELDPAPFALGFLSFLQFLPVLLFSLWAGVIADRIDRRRLLFVTQSVATVQAVLIAVIVTAGVVKPWMVYVLALVYGVFNAFDLPARQSFLVELVGKEDLSNAIALNSAAFNSARIFGPAVAGILVAAMPGWIRALGIAHWFHGPLIGEAGCFWINAISFIAMLWGLGEMRLAPRAVQAATRTFDTLREGVRYALDIRPIRNLLVLLGCTTSLGFQYTTLLPIYARDILKSDAGAFGALMSAFGVGSLTAAALLTRRQDRWNLRRNLLAGLLTSGIGMVGFAWSRSLALSLAMGFLIGFGLILYVASTNTMLQLTTEDRYRGRVMSLYTLMFVGTAPIGALVAGAIAQHAGAPIATTFSAGVLLLGALWTAYRLRVLAAREAAAQPPEPAATERMG